MMVADHFVVNHNSHSLPREGRTVKAADVISLTTPCSL
jgi:hypothetical protein